MVKSCKQLTTSLEGCTKRSNVTRDMVPGPEDVGQLYGRQHLAASCLVARYCHYRPAVSGQRSCLYADCESSLASLLMFNILIAFKT